MQIPLLLVYWDEQVWHSDGLEGIACRQLGGRIMVQMPLLFWYPWKHWMQLKVWMFAARQLSGSNLHAPSMVTKYPSLHWLHLSLLASIQLTSLKVQTPF